MLEQALGLLPQWPTLSDQQTRLRQFLTKLPVCLSKPPASPIAPEYTAGCKATACDPFSYRENRRAFPLPRKSIARA